MVVTIAVAGESELLRGTKPSRSCESDFQVADSKGSRPVLGVDPLEVLREELPPIRDLGGRRASRRSSGSSAARRAGARPRTGAARRKTRERLPRSSSSNGTCAPPRASPTPPGGIHGHRLRLLGHPAEGLRQALDEQGPPTAEVRGRRSSSEAPQLQTDRSGGTRARTCRRPRRDRLAGGARFQLHAALPPPAGAFGRD
jgi:hypothetical protein